MKIMNNLGAIFAVLATTASLMAQAPQKMSYQAVVRNSANALVTNQNVGMQISILQGNSSGAIVYMETQTPTSNANGLVSLEIGGGTVVNGNFAAIDWSNGPYFIKTETDPAGGTNYSITGTNQLLTVPYALYAKTAETVSGQITEIDPIFGTSVASGISQADITNWNVDNDATNELQQLSVSALGDTLLLQQGGFVIIPGISAANTPPPTFPVGTVHCNPSNPTAIVDVTNPITGRTWMDRNLGATQVATSSTDINSYGDLYQWGRRSDGHQCRTSQTTTTLSSTDQPTHGNFIIISGSLGNIDWRSPQNNNLWQGVNGVNNPCPSGYRLPTETELNSERASWGSNNAAGAFASMLKWPRAGRRSWDGSFTSVNQFSWIWSSTISGTNAQQLNFGANSANMDIRHRADGLSVRCIKH